DNRARFYFTTIAAGNKVALRMLTSGRAGLPMYHPAGVYHTLAIPLPRRPSPPAAVPGLTIRSACRADLPSILDFLTEAGPRRQFFPRYWRDDFLAPDGLLRGI